MFLLLIFGIFLVQGGVLAFEEGDDFYGQGFTVLVTEGPKPICTASLISKFWSITVCSVIKDINHSKLNIRIVDPLQADNHRTTLYSINTVRVHPNCVDKNGTIQIENDLALLFTEEPFKDSGAIFIAKIPRQLTYWTPDSQLPLTFSTVDDLAGNGNTLKKTVFETKIKLARPKDCANLVSAVKSLVGYAMCGSYNHPKGKQNCKLDIGAGLSYEGMIVGVLSLKAEGCGSATGIALYTNTAYHSQWIREEIKRKTEYVKI